MPLVIYFCDTGDDKIVLCGYSRGAVTCFEVAKQLQQLAPDVPIEIIADQPVPGNMTQLKGTNAASIKDCSKLTNITKATIILGAYTGRFLSAIPTLILVMAMVLPMDKLHSVGSKVTWGNGVEAMMML